MHALLSSLHGPTERQALRADSLIHVEGDVSHFAALPYRRGFNRMWHNPSSVHCTVITCEPEGVVENAIVPCAEAVNVPTGVLPAMT